MQGKNNKVTTDKKIFLVETCPEGLKTIKSHLFDINAKHAVFATLSDAMSKTDLPDLVILLARNNAENCNEDIVFYHSVPSFSKIPLMLILPLQGVAKVQALKRDKCQYTFQMPVDKLDFLSKVAGVLKVPPRRVFQIVITIMEESGNIRYSGISVDFSENGMAFECNADFAVGHKIIVRFINPKNREKFFLHAEVMRKSGTQQANTYFYGVSFNKMTFGEMTALGNFISG